MDPNLFKSQKAGRVIRVGEGVSSYYAFVPSPLPPDIPPSWKLTTVISEADRAISELAGLGRMLPNPNLFINPFLRREAVLSSRIEGTQSDLTDLYVFESGQVALPGLQPPEADVREVYNYVRALEYGLEQLKESHVNLWLLRGLHDVLLQGVRGQYATPGEFRTRQNWIGGDTINSAIYVPPPVIELLPALDALQRYFYADDDLPLLIRLALIHYQFEAIHPFVDGNGRIGRLMLSLLLVSWNLLELPLLHLSAYFERHRETYYDLLLNVSQKGDWQGWLEFFLRSATIQARETIERIKRLQDLQREWTQRLDAIKASRSAFLLTERMLEAPVTTIPGAQKTLGMSSYVGAQRVVEKLVQTEILKPVDERGYGKVYAAQEILDILANHKSAG